VNLEGDGRGDMRERDERLDVKHKI
jgi:hypothetical protein